MPWERRLWSGRPAWWSPHLRNRREHYILTELRLVRLRGARVDELALHDIADVQRTSSWLERRTGTSTVVVHARGRRGSAIALRGIRRGEQVAALLELLSGDPRPTIDLDAARSAVAWEPNLSRAGIREGIGALAAVVIAIFAVVVGLHGKSTAIVYPADDAIYPGGVKRSREDVVRFMQREVMPWARVALAPIVGGPGRVSCETCHGRRPEARDWRMPAVAALPQPDVVARGWETYGGTMDAQMRNAIYGYLAESDKQAKATYMREVVMPGMAHLLRRPAYDFTQPYEYNRARLAFGCYHCHMVKPG